MKKKLFTLMTFMLCVVVSSHADGTATVVKTWDFTSVSSTDATAFTSNSTDWASESSYYKNAKAISDYTEFSGITMLSGLQFKANATDYIRIYTDGHGLRLAYNETNNTSIKIVGLKANQIISVTCEGAAKDGQRGVSATNVSNFTNDNSFTKTSTDVTEHIGYVKSDGEVVLSVNAGDIYVTKISVSKVVTTEYTETIKLNADGIITYSTDVPLDFSTITNMSAYVATKTENGNGGVTMTKLAGFVPAGTGIMVKGDANASANVPLGTSNPSVPSSNFLVATVTETTVEASTNSTYNYIFGKYTKDGTSEIGFYKVSSGTFTSKANKAYLKTNKDLKDQTDAKFLSLNFEDETTGIGTVKTAKSEDNVYYTLSGVRVAQPQKGLYIVNGKKVIVK